jgi:hypothetical protein
MGTENLNVILLNLVLQRGDSELVTRYVMHRQHYLDNHNWKQFDGSCIGTCIDLQPEAPQVITFGERNLILFKLSSVTVNTQYDLTLVMSCTDILFTNINPCGLSMAFEKSNLRMYSCHLEILKRCFLLWKNSNYTLIWEYFSRRKHFLIKVQH